VPDLHQRRAGCPQLFQLRRSVTQSAFQQTVAPAVCACGRPLARQPFTRRVRNSRLRFISSLQMYGLCIQGPWFRRRGSADAFNLTVLHRLLDPGSDCAADRWKEDFQINEAVGLHNLYRAMGWLGEELTPIRQRCAERAQPKGPHRYKWNACNSWDPKLCWTFLFSKRLPLLRGISWDNPSSCDVPIHRIAAGDWSRRRSSEGLRNK
jgi:hypothetical protein